MGFTCFLNLNSCNKGIKINQSKNIRISTTDSIWIKQKEGASEWKHILNWNKSNKSWTKSKWKKHRKTVIFYKRRFKYLSTSSNCACVTIKLSKLYYPIISANKSFSAYRHLAEFLLIKSKLSLITVQSLKVCIESKFESKWVWSYSRNKRSSTLAE